VKLGFLILLLTLTEGGLTAAVPANWTGHYAACDHHNDLLSRRYVDLGVRFSTTNPALTEEFKRALNFWSGVLDLDWHEVNSEACAVQLVDGSASLFNFCACLSAKAQLPDRPGFQGWIAFNPRMKLTRQQMFVDSVHEIGHLLGLAHNPDDNSVMFYFGTDRTVSLDATDLDALAARHQLRPYVSFRNREIREVRVSIATTPTSHPSSGGQMMAWYRRVLQVFNGPEAVLLARRRTP
jgi:hypothetical protein